MKPYDPDETPVQYIDRLEAEIGRLGAALKPFADCAEMMEVQGINPPDERMLMYASEGGGTFLGYASVGDLRKARAALMAGDHQ